MKTSVAGPAIRAGRRCEKRRLGFDWKPHRTPRSVLAVSVVHLCVVLTGCASVDEPRFDDSDDAQVTIVDMAFDGTYIIESLVVDSMRLQLDGQPNVSIDAEVGTLEVDAGCGIQLGSFSLDASGGASFTVLGGVDATSCTLIQQHNSVLSGLAAVTEWESDADRDGFCFFDGAGENRICLRRFA